MKSNGLCRLCGMRKAELPDRNTTSLRKRICRQCHSKRLMSDFRAVVASNSVPLMRPEKETAQSH